MPGLLRLRISRAVQRLRGRPVAPVRHLPAPPARPPPGHHPETVPRPGPHPVRQGGGDQARGIVHFHAVIRLDAPGEGLPAPARPSIDADMLCNAIDGTALRHPD